MESLWTAELSEAFASVLQAVATISFMAFVGERLVELLKPVFAPLLDWLQGLASRHLECGDGWATMLFALLVQGLVVAATEINAFEPFVPARWAGVALTILVGAGGSNFVHDIWPGQSEGRSWRVLGDYNPEIENQP